MPLLAAFSIASLAQLPTASVSIAIWFRGFVDSLFDGTAHPLGIEPGHLPDNVDNPREYHTEAICDINSGIDRRSSILYISPKSVNELRNY